MKRSIFFLLVVLSLCLSLPTAAQVRLGVVGGLNLSKVSFDQLPDCSSSNRTGWYLGPKVQLNIPVIGIGLDVAAEYSQRKLNNVDNSYTYRSLEIPLNLRYQLGISLAKVYVATGPQFGFQIGNDIWKSGGKEFKLKNSNTTWNVGAGVQLFNHLELGAVYNIAISKYAKSLNGDGTIKANTWQIQAAYLF